jgi:NAD kinase
MFSKVFVAWRKDYGEKIVLRVCGMLREAGIAYVFDEPGDCDLAIMVGGDGTLLKYQSPLGCPMLGINPGESVGYYMSANGRDFEKKLRRLLEGEDGKDYFIKEFTRLETTINKIPLPFLALNEVLISPIYVRRAFKSELNVKGRTTKEKNSGILVYTPSGSNAYAKSAGARPMKDTSRFGVTAIAPYSGMLKRGEITLDKGGVSVKCLSDEGETCIDGREEQVCRLKANDVVAVKKSGRHARIVCFRE